MANNNLRLRWRMTEGRKLLLATLAPAGYTVIGLVLRIPWLAISGLVFTALVLVAGLIRRTETYKRGHRSLVRRDMPPRSRRVRCSVRGCSERMSIVSNAIITREMFARSRECLRCTACGRYTCAMHSAHEQPCKCGHQRWVQQLYVQGQVSHYTPPYLR